MSSSKTFINDKIENLESIIEDPFYSASNSLHDNIFGSLALNNDHLNEIKNFNKKTHQFKEINLENANDYSNLCFSDDDRSLGNSIFDFHNLNYNRNGNNLVEEEKSQY